MGECPTICADDCAEQCHEAHQPAWMRDHAPASHGADDVPHEPPHDGETVRDICREPVVVLDEPPLSRPCGRIRTGGHCGVHS